MGLTLEARVFELILIFGAVLFAFLDAEVFPRSLKRVSAPNQLGFVL
jgi:hypothetical protein